MRSPLARLAALPGRLSRRSTRRLRRALLSEPPLAVGFTSRVCSRRWFVSLESATISVALITLCGVPLVYLLRRHGVAWPR